jgi:protein AATF/BFR2
MDILNSCLDMRIHLQRCLDVANRFPVANDFAAYAASEDVRTQCSLLAENLRDALIESSSLVSSQLGTEVEDVGAVQGLVGLAKQKWTPVVDKWHQRMNYGAEISSAKLRVLNHSVFDSIQFSMADKVKAVEKSRLPLDESRRLGIVQAGRSRADSDSDDDGSSVKKVRYDEEVYDDRQLYSLLLKTFIAATTCERGALPFKKLQRTQRNVDRKASKGRKIRYVVHPKLQNFTFPIVGPEPDVDSAGLKGSLFK